jgi:hypothetical protein
MPQFDFISKLVVLLHSRSSWLLLAKYWSLVDKCIFILVESNTKADTRLLKFECAFLLLEMNEIYSHLFHIKRNTTNTYCAACSSELTSYSKVIWVSSFWRKKSHKNVCPVQILFVASGLGMRKVLWGMFCLGMSEFFWLSGSVRHHEKLWLTMLTKLWPTGARKNK